MPIYLHIDIRQQQLRVCTTAVEPDRAALRALPAFQTYPISSSRFGVGEVAESYCTPRGWHVVRVKIGEGMPLGAVFMGRRPTGVIYCPALGVEFPARDWILTRLLWLGGLERGRNKGGTQDSLRRYIYIHGTAEEALIGTPASHGCVRMRNQDIIDLCAWVKVGTKVFIDG